MFDLVRKAHARRAAERKIPVYYSTVPRLRPQGSILVAICAAAMLAIVADSSGARAQTTSVTADTAITLAQSAPSGPPPGTQDGQRPPREAMEACASVPLETVCSFAGREGEQITGTCRSPDADVPAACVPADMPQNG